MRARSRSPQLLFLAQPQFMGELPFLDPGATPGPPAAGSDLGGGAAPDLADGRGLVIDLRVYRGCR